MKILFSDHDSEKCNRFLDRFPGAITATSPGFAINCIKTGKFDVVCTNQVLVLDWIRDHYPVIKRLYITSLDLPDIASYRSSLGITYPTFCMTPEHLQTFTSI